MNLAPEPSAARSRVWRPRRGSVEGRVARRRLPAPPRSGLPPPGFPARSPAPWRPSSPRPSSAAARGPSFLVPRTPRVAARAAARGRAACGHWRYHLRSAHVGVVGPLRFAGGRGARGLGPADYRPTRRHPRSERRGPPETLVAPDL